MKRRKPKGSSRLPTISMNAIARDYLGLAREEMRVARHEKTAGVNERSEYAWFAVRI